eukprot:3942008-Rhodomonas_salina.7
MEPPYKIATSYYGTSVQNSIIIRENPIGEMIVQILPPIRVSPLCPPPLPGVSMSFEGASKWTAN